MTSADLPAWLHWFITIWNIGPITLPVYNLKAPGGILLLLVWTPLYAMFIYPWLISQIQKMFFGKVKRDGD